MVDGAELVRFYKSLGYDGVCITDHFINFTVAPRDLPWNQRIELFYKGFEAAYEEGIKIGISVFFAWEFSYKATDFLTYGLNKEWLLEHEGLTDLNAKEYLNLVRESGGIAVHAHPFREARHIDYIRLFPRDVDAVETINSSMDKNTNDNADWYAKAYDLKAMAGSDIHRIIRKNLAGIKTNKKLTDINDFVEAVKSGQYETFTLNLP